MKQGLEDYNSVPLNFCRVVSMYAKKSFSKNRDSPKSLHPPIMNRIFVYFRGISY